ncbi:MAG: hypothetical protein PUK40_02170 [Actinomycetaceae bacterium]|nr:hypothetical protein [Arcanobacterium sp.]MDD7504747.1 hypothetical protein [Actinomycetaceae bacterium]
MTPEALTAIGAILVPLCSLIASIITGYLAYKAKQTSEQTREKTDSARKTWNEVAMRVNPEQADELREQIRLITTMQRSQGHQIGELNKHVDSLRKDIFTLIANEILK